MRHPSNTSRERHGGPYDRGSADAYYRRPPEPHYYTGATYSTTRIEQKDMSQEEIEDYRAGYEEEDDRKQYA